MAALGGLVWGLYEAQRVDCRIVEVSLRRLPAELDGLRVLHLSDLHLGSLSLNERALARAVGFAARADPELVVVTGDLLARQAGEPVLRRALRNLPARYGRFAVLGNVDVAETRDPFSAGTRLADLGPHARLLDGERVTLDVRGRSVLVAGASPGREADPGTLATDADLRILLAHYPETVDDLPDGAFDLVLSGHTHGGQICIPYPGGKIRFGGFELRPPYPEGRFDRGDTTLVVSRGTGTTFVPFRYFARPEAALLVLRAQ